MVSLFVCLHAAAIGMTTNLNPFAYNLSATLSADQSELTIKYCLNADVTSLKIVIEGEGQTITHNVTEASKLKKTVADKPYFSPYEETFSTDGLGAGTFTWRIEVTGAGRNEIQVYSQDGTNAHTYPFYLPSSVDIVKDTRSFNYGKVIVVEGSHSGKGNANFHSNEIGAGLYVFNPDFTPILNRNNKPGFNGGSATWGNTSNNYFANTTHAPRRVRVSKDGRIFVSSMYKHTATKHPYIHGIVLWEVDPYFSKWSTVMGDGVNGAKYDVTAISADNTKYYNNQLQTSGGSFIAGPCAGLDVRGEGSQLKLLLLSCDYRAFAANYQGFHLCEYNLGTATAWGSTPSKTFNVTTENATTNPTKRLFAAPTNSNVQYDKDGGVWCISNRASTSADQPALVHKNADLSEDYRNTERKNTKNAGFRFNNDYTKVIIATEGSIGTIYDYTTKANGYFINPTQIDMSAAGEYLNDFAWDNANNIYAVAQNNNSNIGGEGKIAVYCMPYTSSDIFTTPGPTTLTIDCAEGITYTVETSVNDASMGSATGGGTFVSCSDVTLVAKSKGGYRFVNWTENDVEVSQDSTYTFTLTRNVNLKANFAVNIFDVEWYNLFQNKQDITDYITNPNSSMDGAVNSRLYRLFQVQFNEYFGLSITSNKFITETETGKSVFHVLAFLDNQQTNTTTFMTNRNSPFYWLGEYIKATIDENIQNNTYEWPYLLHLFFNRTNKPYSINGTYVGEYDGVKAYFKNNVIPDFSETGKPTHWRTWWTKYACELPTTQTYETNLPKNWNKHTPPTGSIAGLKPSAWYRWNSDTAKVNENKMLAWYYDDPANPTWPENPTIVRNVDHSGALFATWVDKLISEDKNNSDVIWLLNHHNGTHQVQVSRKLQAGMYNTICLPFSIDKSQLASSDLKDATIMEFTGVTENTFDESGESVVVLNFTEVTNMLAGQPYLIKPNNNDITTNQIINSVISGYTNEGTPIILETPGSKTITTTNGSITFQATINPTSIPEGAIILVANNRLALNTSSNEQLKGLRAYFNIDDADLQTLADEGRMYLSIKKPTTTSVPVAPEAEQQTQPKVRKVMQDGKIYIIRGEEIYTISGMRVQ